MGPSGFARFMAGCSCEQEDALYRDIEEYEEQKITVITGLPTDSAHQLAQSIVTRRRQEDNRYKETDRLGTEGEGPQFVFTKEGDVYFPQFDSTLGDMYTRQKTLRPDEYSETEHRTVVSAYRSLREGATQAAHIVHHFNQNGQLDVRDAIVLTYDPLTKSGRMHILNISHLGETHTSEESAVAALQERLNGFAFAQEQYGESPLLVRTEDPVDPASLFIHPKEVPPVRESEMAVENFRHEHVLGDAYAPDDRFIPVVPGRKVVHADSTPEPEIPFVLPEYLQRLMDRDDRGRRVAITDVKPQAMPVVGIVRENPGKPKRTPESVRRIRTENPRIGNEAAPEIGPEEQRLREPVQQLEIVEKTGVGIAGIFVLLNRLRTGGETHATPQQRPDPVVGVPSVAVEAVLFVHPPKEPVLVGKGGKSRAPETTRPRVLDAVPTTGAIRERRVLPPEMPVFALRTAVAHMEKTIRTADSPLSGFAQWIEPVSLRHSERPKKPDGEMLPTLKRKRRRSKERSLRQRRSRLVADMMTAVNKLVRAQRTERPVDPRKTEVQRKQAILPKQEVNVSLSPVATEPRVREDRMNRTEQPEPPISQTEAAQQVTLIILLSCLMTAEIPAVVTGNNPEKTGKTGQPEQRHEGIGVQLWMYLALIYYAGLLREHTASVAPNLPVPNNSGKKRKRGRRKHRRSATHLSRQGIIYVRTEPEGYAMINL